jgi:YjbE family integral membrane protein
MEMFTTPEFWIAVGQIILIDILLGGDNAVVIALACRSLPPEQRTKGILWGTAGAIVLRIILIFFALTLLAIPFLKIVGALLLVWIGVKLLLPEEGHGAHGNVAASDKLWGAVKTVIIADLVMSVDNVIAIAGAAESSGTDHGMALVIFGVLVSIPIIVWGSQMVLKLMDRYPIVITVGGMLLGWIAGTMAVTDPAVARWVPYEEGVARPDVIASVRYGAGIAGALLVLALGKWFGSRRRVAPAPAGVAAAADAPIGHLQRVLLAVDGSEGSALAVRRLAALRDDLRHGATLELHTITVQRPLSGDVTRFIAGKTVDDYHREQCELALAPARAALGVAGIVPQEHQRTGEPGPTIAEAARELGCDMIVMGARGLGSPAAALLGSVTQSTIEHASVPVLVVK